MTNKIDSPQEGKIYSLTAGVGQPCILAGNSWAESEVPPSTPETNMTNTPPEVVLPPELLQKIEDHDMVTLEEIQKLANGLAEDHTVERTLELVANVVNDPFPFSA